MEIHQHYSLSASIIDANLGQSAVKFPRNPSVMLRHFLAFVLLTIASSMFAIGCGQTTEQASDPKIASDTQVQQETQLDLPEAPDFTLPAANKGTEISLAQFRGDKPVVIVFYRAYW